MTSLEMRNRVEVIQSPLSCHQISTPLWNWTILSDTLELAFMGIVLDSVSLIVISLAVMVAIRIVRRKIRQGEQKYMLPYFIRNLLWIILGFGFLIFHLFEESWYGNAGTQVVAFLFSIVDIVFKLSTCYILFVLYVQMNFQDEIAKRIKILTYLEWLVGEDSDRPGRWTWAELELLAEEIEENDGHLTRRARRVLELSYPNTERPELPDLAKFAAGDDSKIKFEFYEDLGHADADHFFEDEVLDENVMDADMAIFMHGQFYGAPVRPRGK